MVKLAAKNREITGKNVKKLRNEGFLPAVVYGAGNKPQNLSISASEFGKAWRSAGESTLIDLDVDGGAKKSVLIHDVALDPLKDFPLHVDFLEVSADRKITASVPLVFDGEPPAVKSLGGTLMKLLHEVEIEALPKNLIHELKIDVSVLETFDDTIVLGDLALPDGVELLSDGDVVVAKVEEPRKEEEPADDVDISAIEVEKKGKKEEAVESGEKPEE